MPRFTSTKETLAANGTWDSGTLQGGHEDNISGIVFSDQAGTLYVDQSIDGTNWDLVESFPVTAGTGRTFSASLFAPYYRLRYVNGATAQGAFRLSARPRSTGYRG